VIGVPGLTGNLEHFRFLGEHIGGDQLQLLALDLRGRGKSEITPSGTYGWENHALDVLAAADALGSDRFAVVGQSMGGSIAMKIAARDCTRLEAVVLVDVAGRVDRGVGPVIAAATRRLDRVYDSAEHYLDEVRAQGLIEPWDPHWDRAYRYELQPVDRGVAPRTSAEAVAEDRAYTATQDPYGRWRHLTMPTLLLRATRELLAGSGFVVPADDRDRFARDVPGATVVEIDANHLTINVQMATAAAIRRFLCAVIQT
jgi:pimeloyl-ACP methyl ester carboxylesterase